MMTLTKKVNNFNLTTGLREIPVTSTETQEVTQSVYDRLCNTVINNEEAFQEALRRNSGFEGNVIVLGELPEGVSEKIQELYKGSIFVDSELGSNTYCKIDERYYICFWVFKVGAPEGKMLLVNIDDINDVINGDDI